MAKKTTRKQNSARSPAEPGSDRPEYVPGYQWDAESAKRPAEFIEQFCRVPSSDGGDPVHVKLIDWQRDRVIAPLFGWKRPDGRLRYRRGAVFVPKKNGKTWLMSGIAQYLLTAHQPLADVYPAAVDREQARILYRMLKRSVEASPTLSKVLEVVDSKSIIRNRKHGNVLRCLSADAYRNEGLNGSVIIDEIHAHRTDELVSALSYATRATPNGLVLAISTAGDDRKGPGYQWWTDCELVQKNPAANPTFYGLIFAANPATDDMDSPETWRRANPSMGITFPEEEFKADWQDAKTSPTKWQRWLRYSVNVWSTPDNRWFTPELYAHCVAPPPEPLDGRACFIGLDLADHLDLTAAVALFPDGQGGYDADAMFWMPSDNVADREREARVPLRQWIDDGWIRTTPGVRLDHDQVAADIIAYSQTHKVRGVGADPWNLGSVATQLHRHGIEVSAVGQNVGRMTAPSKLLEGLIHEKKFRCPSPVMQWMAGNVCLYVDHAGNMKPDKGRSKEKTDGIVAAVCGLAIASTAEPETSPDAWQIVPM
jgi:phage terminase large subunit-like protein